MKRKVLMIAILLATSFTRLAYGESDARCQALASADFSTIPEAPTVLTAASPTAAREKRPAFCRVQGYVSPSVGFELRLPIDTWNGKFLEVGCGGFCGILDGAEGACNDPLRRGYACVATDMGHKGTIRDSLWAYNNLQAEIDFGFRATHVTALAGKAIAERFYAKAPHKSYFVGCSQGGRQALMSAQKYPWDFDGIIAGAPALTGMGLRQLWITAVTVGPDGKPILDASDMEMLHRAVMEECDRDDGFKDGLIGDPLACRARFDPSRLPLTPPQIAAIRKIYDGPRTSKGEDLYAGGHIPGVERAWLATVIPDKKTWIGNDVLRYMTFLPDPGPGWNVVDFDLDHDYKRMQTMHAIQGADNPDLRKFKAAGGKLLAYHGWNDVQIVPINTVDYYETVQRTMGGPADTQDFFRLFMIPGMAHCTGGDGTYAIDYLSALEAWVEKGRAPDFLIAAHPKDAYKDDVREGRLSPPLDPNVAKFTRPIYPYPATAKYRGKGDPNDASSFVPVKRPVKP